MTDSEYALLDLGGGRQLARFGALVVDRPFPAAVERPRDEAAWNGAELRFDRLPGLWRMADDSTPPTAWPMRHDGLTFELRPTPSGQVGFFAEQIEPWRWIRDAVSAAPGSVLNLFAYTGGSTLAAAAAGARVTHVDASRSAVAWARRNAELSGLAAAPIRWIVDDAIAFTAREARRGGRYQGVVLDPPSYGHGPRGERWTLGTRLPELLDACLDVLDEPGFLLLTAHAEGLAAEDLAVALEDAFLRSGRRGAAAAIDAALLTLVARSGARAPAGVAVRWRSR